MNNNHLEFEDYYFPFAVKNRSLGTNFDVRIKRQRNIGGSTGITKSLNAGSTAELVIFSSSYLMSNYRFSVKDYMWNEVIKDYQSFMNMGSLNDTENKQIGSLINDTGNLYGNSNGIIDYINSLFSGVLGFGNVDLGFTRAYTMVLRWVASSKMLASTSVFLKQFGSVMTIFRRHGWSFAKGVKTYNKAFIRLFGHNTVGTKANETFNYLCEHCEAFLERANSSPANLSLYNDMTTYYNKVMNKVNDIAGFFAQRADLSVIMSVYEMLVNDMKLSEEEAIDVVFDIIENDVASTDSAFRAPIQNAGDAASKTIAFLGGENIMQFSGVLSSMAENRMGIGDSKRLLRRVLGLVESSIYSGMITTLLSLLRGEIDFDDIPDDVLNEIILDNILAVMPLIDKLLAMIRVNIVGAIKGNKSLLEFGYAPNVPMFQAIGNWGRATVNAFKFNENSWYNFYKSIIYSLEMIGVPLKNISRPISTLSYLLSPTGVSTFVEMDKFFRNKTNQQILNEAVKRGQTKKAEYLIGKEIDSSNLSYKIALYCAEAKTGIRLHNSASFKSDGSKYTVSDSTHRKYYELTEKTLNSLFETSKFNSLSKEDKVKAIQRVINYYFNCSKKETVSGKNYDYKDKAYVIENAVKTK